MAENAHPGTPTARDSVPQIDLAAVFGASAKKNKKNKNKNRSTSTLTSLNSRTPMGVHNRMSSHGTPLGLLSPASSQTDVLADDTSSGLRLDQQRGPDQEREEEQDPARLLISPPPEELLQLASRRSSFNRTSANLTSIASENSHMNATTPLLPPSLPKRKRSMAPTLPPVPVATNSMSRHSGPSTVALSSDAGDAPELRESTIPLEATPNPKPRKQSRRIGRAHVRTQSNQSDLSMQSIPSPTRPSMSVMSSSQSLVNEEPVVSAQDATPSCNTTSTTPQRERHGRFSLVKSPHAENPDADYRPPLRLLLPDTDESPEDKDLLLPQIRLTTRTGRRSTTPVVIPPYEPPSEVFTPPREVVISPITSTSKSKRKSGRTRALKVHPPVKKEAPEIDLSEPMPPASPTDDPLLLSGPPEEFMSTPVRSRRRVMRDAGVITSILRSENEGRPRRVQRSPVRMQESLPPSSPPPPHDDDSSSSPVNSEGVEQFHWFNGSQLNVHDSSTDSMDFMDVDPNELAQIEGPLPDLGFGTGGLPAINATFSSDSEDEQDLQVSRTPRTPRRVSGVLDEGVGEYTGRWRMMQVRTKADPPSSATRMRIEEWGRPISPYPYTLDRSSRPPSRQNMRRESTSPSPANRSDSYMNDTSPFAEADGDTTIHPIPSTKADLGVVSVEPREDEVLVISQEPELQVAGLRDEIEQEEEEVRRLSMEPDSEDYQEEEEEEEVHEMGLGPDHGDPEEEKNGVIITNSEEHDTDEEEEQEVREMSIEHDADVPQSQLSRPPIRASSAHGEARQHPTQPVNLLRNLMFLGSPSGFDRRRNPRASASFDRAKQLFGERSSPIKSIWSGAPHSAVEETGEGNDGQNFVESMQSDMLAEKTDISTQERVRRKLEVRASNNAEQEPEVSSDDEGDSSDLEDPGVVQITSSDPRAAARAAAILKQHDYDCFTKIAMKQRQRRNRASTSNVTLDDFKRGNRRNTLADGGVTKGKKRASMGILDKSRRQSIGGVIGDRVYIPGSPVMTLGGLLKEAEEEVQIEKPKESSPRNVTLRMAFGDRDAFHTPVPPKFKAEKRPSSALTREVACPESDSEDEPEEEAAFIREWTKEEWKVLDGCFTDERIELAQYREGDNSAAVSDEVHLASADLVVIDKVVARFIDIMGGQKTVDAYGWSRDSLRTRAKALQNKQRAGHVAAPTSPYSSPNVFEKSRRPSHISVPDFTPLSRASLTARRTKAAPVTLPPPAGESAPFSNIPDDLVEPRRVPALLLAPRYSHLLDEAIAISRDMPYSPDLAESEDLAEETAVSDAASNVSVVLDHQGTTTQHPPDSAIKRVKNFMFSYLPTLSKSSTKPSRQVSRGNRPGLPLPPAEVLEKPRGPINTPAKPAAPKPKHPKELVNLHHQPIPEKKGVSMIPRSKPKRLVELHKIGLPEERAAKEDIPVARMRRSSGGSVKDLIKGFEERSLDQKQVGAAQQLRRTKSIGEWQKGLPGREKGANARPTWKP